MVADYTQQLLMLQDNESDTAALESNCAQHLTNLFIP